MERRLVGRSENKPVIHHPGSGYVTRCTWSQFMKDNEFQGVYEPDDNPSSSERDDFVYMARELEDEEIKYNPYTWYIIT